MAETVPTDVHKDQLKTSLSCFYKMCSPQLLRGLSATVHGARRQRASAGRRTTPRGLFMKPDMPMADEGGIGGLP